MAKKKKIELLLKAGQEEAINVEAKLNLRLSRPLKSDVMIVIAEAKDMTSERQRKTARLRINRA